MDKTTDKPAGKSTGKSAGKSATGVANRPNASPQSRSIAESTAALAISPEKAGRPSSGCLPSPATRPDLDKWPSASFASEAFFDLTDRAADAVLGRYSLGLSPAALIGLYFDWMLGLAFAPGKRAELVDKAMRKWIRLANYTAQQRVDPQTPPCIEPLPQDRRFTDPAWHEPPFNVIYQSFLLNQQWWHNATTGIKGLTREQENAISFSARQILDVFAPSNFPLTNPEILERTVQTSGNNLVQGWNNFWDDWQRAVAGRKPVGTESFPVGERVAVTPGKVVLQNDLIELIQYEPATRSVHPQPILITPAWIMKYYILDLSPHNSLVGYLVSQGFTVFMISWKNPQSSDREKSMDDYMRLGPLAAIDAIRAIVPGADIHAVGYCLGGTLLAIAAAALDREGRSPFATLSFLAAQIDFEEPGELRLFINERQLSFLENIMWEQGYLDSRQMAGTFQLLRSNDLVWSRQQHEYLMGERQEMFDLMAWNADTTRMPFRMHSEYLRRLFLNNDLTEGRYMVAGAPVSIRVIRPSIFALGTQTDHVAPWRSVYRFNFFANTEVTFVLTNGGHNGGIVSEPGRKGRHYQADTRQPDDPYVDPDTWAKRAPVADGSWWPYWVDWLAGHSSSRGGPPKLGRPEEGYGILCDAPGQYVHQK